ncbi:xanthine dehydrogenase small subunit [soil metagenome]
MEINFILNKESISADVNPAIVVLDYIRKNEHLTGTKEGCKEGDCGACTVLIGELKNDRVVYKSINSCLYPLGNVNGKHVVTIEGFNLDGSSIDRNLNSIQEEFLIEGASQCGFCTPGFIVSLNGYFLTNENRDLEGAIDSMDGNICRCTGHNSIIRAAENVITKFKDTGSSIASLIESKLIPEYFNSIADRLTKLKAFPIRGLGTNGTNGHANGNAGGSTFYVGGGSDLFVQKPELMIDSNIKFLNNITELSFVKVDDGICKMGSTTTVSDILSSNEISNSLKYLKKFIELFGSTPIRNSATIGGNINNGSPIGDMTAFFMALNSTVVLTNGMELRRIPLKEYYTGYKQTQKKPSEYMHSLEFKIPTGNYYYNFEKVSKRTFLDIASVNTGILINFEDEIISEIHISAGGVFATPLYLKNTVEYLTGKELNLFTIKEAVSIAEMEIAPISDARGSSDYKRLLLKRLLYAHFITLFPEIINVSETI